MEQGQIVLLKFPQTDLNEGKLRPVLLISKLPGKHDDWLACMVSTKYTPYLENLDEEISETDPDFIESGLKSASVVRILRLAVINKNIMLGKIGLISSERLKRIKNQISKWILDS